MKALLGRIAARLPWVKRARYEAAAEAVQHHEAWRAALVETVDGMDTHYMRHTKTGEIANVERRAFRDLMEATAGKRLRTRQKVRLRKALRAANTAAGPMPELERAA